MSTGAKSPQQFGKYTLMERIAVGGMAEIWRAKTFGAAGFEKELVIKRILQQFSVDEDFVRMFIDEARLAARLQHANVVQIFDFDSVEIAEGVKNYYIAMEWVDGKDLRHLLKEGVRRRQPIPYADCLHIAIETLKGLHYAHTRADGGKPLSIVHRDVSPHNVLVSYSGDVKISDFGIAKAAARASATSNGMVKGKLAYMSPEQITGQPLDRRTDVFSMGIVLYEMLTRTRLFVGESEIEVINKVRDGQVPPPRGRNAEIPVDVEQVLMKMLARDVDARFASAADAARALAGTSAYQPSEALALGEYAAQLFPPGQKSAAPLPASGRAASASAVSMASAPSLPPGPRKSAPAAVAAPPAARAASAAAAPHDENAGATMMMEEPPPEVVAAAREWAEAEASRVSAAVAAAPVRAAAAPAAKNVAIAEQSTAILDPETPQGAALAAQIAEARARTKPPPATAEAKPIAEQNTAILDSNNPEVQSAMAKIAAARASAASSASLGSPALAEQKTAILDGNNPDVKSAMAKIAAARSAAPAAAPAPSAGTHPQRTMALDMSATAAASAAAAAARPVQSLPPLPEPAPPPPQHMRWLAGAAVWLATCLATTGLLGVVDSAESARKAAQQQQQLPDAGPAVARVMGRIKLQTNPPNASVRLDGKPLPHATPTTLEGPVGDTVHIEVTLDGYKTMTQDVLFAGSEQTLTMPLDKTDIPPPAPPPEKAPPEKHAADTGDHAAPHPHPAHHATATAPTGSSGARGTVSIFVKPTAIVVIDGKTLGSTPLPDVELGVGPHAVELVNDKLKKREKVSVMIHAGENPPVRRTWPN